MLKIDAKLSIAYHPKTNDQIKRVNVVIKHYLRVFVNYMQDNQAKWLLGVEFVANNASSFITLASPFLTNLGQNPRLGFESSKLLPLDLTTQARTQLINIESFTQKMKELTQHLRNKMLIAQAIYEFNVNRSRCSCLRYFVNDEV